MEALIEAQDQGYTEIYTPFTDITPFAVIYEGNRSLSRSEALTVLKRCEVIQ